MTINKFQGKTEEEAIEKAKQEMGENVVIMNVKTIKPKGVASLFKKTIYEVTAAKEETEQVNPVAAFNSPMKMHEQINLAADDPIQMPPYESSGNFPDISLRSLKSWPYPCPQGFRKCRSCRS